MNERVLEALIIGVMVRTRRFELPHPKALPPQGSVSTVPPRAQFLERKRRPKPPNEDAVQLSPGKGSRKER